MCPCIPAASGDVEDYVEPLEDSDEQVRMDMEDYDVWEMDVNEQGETPTPASYMR